MTFAAFSPVEFHPGEVWLNLLFRKCWFLSAFAKDPKEWEQLWSFIPGVWSLSSKKGQVAAKCYFLGFTIAGKLEQSGTWILSVLTFQLLQLPWNWALKRTEHLLEESL